MGKKKPQTGVVRGRYYEATKEGRGRDAEIAVQVWKGDKKEGEPVGDWGMPGILPMHAAIDQAVLNTISDEKEGR